jgi:hypothetical protein
MIEDMNRGLIVLLDQYSTQWDVSPIFIYSRSYYLKNSIGFVGIRRILEEFLQRSANSRWPSIGLWRRYDRRTFCHVIYCAWQGIFMGCSRILKYGENPPSTLVYKYRVRTWHTLREPDNAACPFTRQICANFNRLVRTTLLSSVFSLTPQNSPICNS